MKPQATRITPQQSKPNRPLTGWQEAGLVIACGIVLMALLSLFHRITWMAMT